MKINNSINNVISRSIILLINFLIVIFSARIWNAEGRGEISLIMLNISLIIIFNKIFSGSTVTYHSPKINKNELLTISFLGSFVISIIGAFIFSFIYNFGFFPHFFIIAFFNSVATSFSSFFLGSKNIKLYNIFIVLSPIGIISYLLILYYIFKITTIAAFFYSNYLAFGSIVILGIYLLFKGKTFKLFKFSFKNFKSIYTYGLGNETSNFFQFLNYRLTFYFISELLGYKELGIFSVAVSIAEAIWIISKSTSAIHFSNVINSNNKNENISQTSLLAKQNFFISLGLCSIFFFIPNDVFIFIFGKSFNNVKSITLYLIPGIIAIATSNLYGHYFAGIGNYKVLKNKSYVGFISTLIFAALLIPNFKLIGACITINISYITSSLYLFYMFTKNKTNPINNGE